MVWLTVWANKRIISGAVVSERMEEWTLEEMKKKCLSVPLTGKRCLGIPRRLWDAGLFWCGAWQTLEVLTTRQTREKESLFYMHTYCTPVYRTALLKIHHDFVSRQLKSQQFCTILSFGDLLANLYKFIQSHLYVFCNVLPPNWPLGLGVKLEVELHASSKNVTLLYKSYCMN